MRAINQEESTWQPKEPRSLSQMVSEAMTELGRAPEPVRDSSHYLNPEAMPTRGRGPQTVLNAVRAAMAMSPDAVDLSHPANRDFIGQPENDLAVDPMMGMGSIGKFEAATKRGNVLHAANEFAPIAREQKTLRELNREALRGGITPTEPSIAFSKKEFEFPDVDEELLKKFKGTKELGELGQRIQKDYRAMYPPITMDIPSWSRLNDGSFTDKQVSRAMEKMKEAESNSGYLWPSPEMEGRADKAFRGVREKYEDALKKDSFKKEIRQEKGAVKRLGKEPRPTRDDPRKSLPDDFSLENIAMAAAKKNPDPIAVQMFLEAHGRGRFNEFRSRSQMDDLAEELSRK